MTNKVPLLSETLTGVCVTFVFGQVTIVTQASELFHVCFKSIIKPIPSKNCVEFDRNRLKFSPLKLNSAGHTRVDIFSR